MTYSYEYINNIYDFQDIEIFGIPGKFTNLRVDRNLYQKELHMTLEEDMKIFAQLNIM